MDDYVDAFFAHQSGPLITQVTNGTKRGSVEGNSKKEHTQDADVDEGNEGMRQSAEQDRRPMSKAPRPMPAPIDVDDLLDDNNVNGDNRTKPARQLLATMNENHTQFADLLEKQLDDVRQMRRLIERQGWGKNTLEYISTRDLMTFLIFAEKIPPNCQGAYYGGLASIINRCSQVMDTHLEDAATRGAAVLLRLLDQDTSEYDAEWTGVLAQVRRLTNSVKISKFRGPMHMHLKDLLKELKKKFDRH